MPDSLLVTPPSHQIIPLQGGSLKISGYVLELSLFSGVKRRGRSRYDFSAHPWREAVVGYLTHIAKTHSLDRFNCSADAMALLGTYFATQLVRAISPEIITAFTEWLPSQIITSKSSLSAEYRCKAVQFAAKKFLAYCYKHNLTSCDLDEVLQLFESGNRFQICWELLTVTEEVLLASGQITRAEHIYKIAVGDDPHDNKAHQYFDFRAHPFSDLIIGFLMVDTAKMKGTSLINRAQSLMVLGRFLTATQTVSLDFDGIEKYGIWLVEEQKFSATRVFELKNKLFLFYQFGLSQKHPDFDFNTAQKIRKWLSRSQRVAFEPETAITVEGGEIARCDLRYKIKFSRPGNRFASITYDFTAHPLATLCDQYLTANSFQAIPSPPATTFNLRCQRLKVLGEFLTLIQQQNLSPDIARAFATFLLTATTKNGEQRFADNSLVNYAKEFKNFYAFGIKQSFANWNATQLNFIKMTFSHKFRGARLRAAQRSKDKTLSLATQEQIYTVIGRELCACRQILTAYQNGQRSALLNLTESSTHLLDPDPFSLFVLYAIGRLGIRSAEFNVLRRDDLLDPLSSKPRLRLHAPNKPRRTIEVTADFVELWNLVLHWDAEARRLASESERNNFAQLPFVFPSSHSFNHGIRLIPLSTDKLQLTLLPRFFSKWFERHGVDPAGKSVPLLHADGNSSLPLRVTLAKLRNAFTCLVQEFTQDIHKTAQVAGHSTSTPTAVFYLHSKQQDQADRTYHALAPVGLQLTSLLTFPHLAGISAPTLQKAEALKQAELSEQAVLPSAAEQFSVEMFLPPEQIFLRNRLARLQNDQRICQQLLASFSAGSESDPPLFSRETVHNILITLSQILPTNGENE